MNEKTKNTLEFIRGVVRPILIAFLGITSFMMVINYDVLVGPWVDIWIGTFVFGGGEWILERPISKVLNNIEVKQK